MNRLPTSATRWLAISLVACAGTAAAQETPQAPAAARPGLEIVAGARLAPGTLLAAQPALPPPRLEAPAPEEGAEASVSWQPAELGLAVLGVVIFVAARLRR